MVIISTKLVSESNNNTDLMISNAKTPSYSKIAFWPIRPFEIVIVHRNLSKYLI